jgi:signal recognition particle subunit SRP19
MNTILPYYSPGLTGGGVSENFFKDMMAEMQGQGGGMPDLGALGALGAASGSGNSGGEPSKKKEKKDKKKGKS